MLYHADGTTEYRKSAGMAIQEWNAESLQRAVVDHFGGNCLHIAIGQNNTKQRLRQAAPHTQFYLF